MKVGAKRCKMSQSILLILSLPHLNCIFSGGVFEVDIMIPKQYPFDPPKVKFISKIWHPNISSQTGAICLVRTNFSFPLACPIYMTHPSL